MAEQRIFSIVQIIVFLAAAAAVWWLFLKAGPKVHDERAEPRVVVARGDLAEEEKTATEIFKNVSRSVVYISNIELRRDFFSLNIYEIPKGTGSGFVWDKDGRIVTNVHVIEDASRVEAVLADNTRWKASIVGVSQDRTLPFSRSPLLRKSSAHTAWRLQKSPGRPKGLCHRESIRP